MEEVATEFETAVANRASDGKGAASRLAQMQSEARRDLTDFYPELDKVPVEELTSWASLAWDWSSSKYVL